MIHERQYPRLAYAVIGLFLMLTLLFAWQIPGMGFSVDFGQYFPEDHPEIQFYQSYKDAFPSLDARTYMAIETPQGIFNAQTLIAVNSASDSIVKLPFVKEVLSLPKLEYYLLSSSGFIQPVPFVHLDQSDKLAEDSLYILEEASLIGTFIGKDFNSLSIQIITEYDLTKTETDQFRDQCLRILSEAGFDQVHLGGRLISQSYVLEYMQREMFLFIIIAAILIVLILLWVYRSFLGLIGPMMVVGGAGIWLLGTMALWGKHLDLLSSLIPAILFVIGISDVVHIYARYLDELRSGKSKTDALVFAYKQVGKANLITSITTAIGFLSLLAASIQPIREFGIFAALGVMYAFVLSYTLFPAVIYLLPVSKLGQRPEIKARWNQQLRNLLGWVHKKKKLIYSMAFLISMASIYGIQQLKVDNFLTEELPDQDQLKNSTTFFERYYAGGRGFDLAVWAKDSSQQDLLGRDIILQIDRLENYLHQEYGIQAIASLSGLVRKVHQSLHEGDPSFAYIPQGASDYQKVRLWIKRSRSYGPLSLIYIPEKKISRIIGYLPDQGGNLLAQKNKALLAFAQQHCPDLEIRLSGMAYLIDLNNRLLVKELLFSLAIAIGLICLIMALLFRSVRMLGIALIPNLLPLLMVGLTMYLLGIDLKVSTVLIFTIAFGIAVDDTIHFLSKFNLELTSGKPLALAIENTFLSTGRAILLTSLILVSGFVSLSFSTFTSSHYFGLLISLTLLYAVLVDLFLLPLLLGLIRKNR